MSFDTMALSFDTIFPENKFSQKSYDYTTYKSDIGDSWNTDDLALHNAKYNAMAFNFTACIGDKDNEWLRVVRKSDDTSTWESRKIQLEDMAHIRMLNIYQCKTWNKYSVIYNYDLKTTRKKHAGHPTWVFDMDPKEHAALSFNLLLKKLKRKFGIRPGNLSDSRAEIEALKDLLNKRREQKRQEKAQPAADIDSIQQLEEKQDPSVCCVSLYNVTGTYIRIKAHPSRPRRYENTTFDISFNPDNHEEFCTMNIKLSGNGKATAYKFNKRKATRSIRFEGSCLKLTNHGSCDKTIELHLDDSEAEAAFEKQKKLFNDMLLDHEPVPVTNVNLDVTVSAEPSQEESGAAQLLKGREGEPHPLERILPENQPITLPVAVSTEVNATNTVGPPPVTAEIAQAAIANADRERRERALARIKKLKIRQCV